MPKRRDEESGKYTEAYPSEEFIEALQSLSGSAGTQEIADEVGCAYRTAFNKLSNLENRGEIKSRKVGNVRLWEISSSE